MLEIQKDESIHSYIYRKHIINGVSDFSNIITSKGDLTAFPTILKNTIHLYEPIDDARFLHLLRDIGLAGITRKTFENPVAYRKDLKKFFGINNDNRRGKNYCFPITYCLKCITKHIQDLGCGIINIKWYYNSFCPIHKSDLYIAKTKSRNEAIKALDCIYRGIHPETYEKPRYRREYCNDTMEYKHKKDCDYIAPCLTDDLKTFIVDNLKNLSVDLLGKNYRSINYISKNYLMNKIYYSAKSSNYIPLMDFLNNFSEIKHLYTGVINRKSITEDIFKSSKVNCGNCKHLNCFSNLAIIPTRPDERLTKMCELNRRLLLDYLDNMGIKNYRKQIEIMNIMSTNQKITALSKFQGSRYDRSYR